MPAPRPIYNCLTNDDFRFICDQYKSGETMGFISRSMGICPKLIREVLLNHDTKLRDTINPNAENAIVAAKLYKEGIGIVEISKRLGLTRKTISKHLKLQGVEKPTRISIHEHKISNQKLVIALHQSGSSIRGISRSTGLVRSLIKNYLSEFGLLKKYIKPNYSLNKDYFSEINTKDKAYWLGFILADGHIQFLKERSYALRIRLQERDLLHLQKFAKDINYNGPVSIKHRYDKFYGKITYKASISIVSRSLCRDLINHGVVDLKKNGNVRILNSIPISLQKHLIRGMFDGDGSISLCNKKNAIMTCASFMFCDMHRPVVQWVQNWLINHFALNQTVMTHASNCHNFIYAGNRQVKRILSFLYKNSGHLKLDRKFEKFKNIGISNKENQIARAA